MTIVSVILMMVLLIWIGSHRKELGFKQYLVIILITIAQLCIMLFAMYTMERPLLY